MDPTLDPDCDTLEDLNGVFETLPNSGGPATQVDARRALERLMEERALRSHLQDDFDLDRQDTPLDW